MPTGKISSTSRDLRCCPVLVMLLATWTMSFTSTLADSIASATSSEESQSDGRLSGEKSIGHSSKIDTRNNSPALNNFLEDVLGAQEELKWIDRAVHHSANNFRNRKSGNRQLRKEQNYQPPEPYKPQRINEDEEIKTKREVDNNENSSSSSLASLKRTILELSDSLKPIECQKSQQQSIFESKRKLLSSELRSALGFAVEYYDYDESADSGSDVLEDSSEREAKREDPASPLIYPLMKPLIPKKNENSEEEHKQEEERQKLKNKYPKEEFISDTDEHKTESSTSTSGKYPEDAPQPPINTLYNSMLLKRIPAGSESEDSDFYTQCKVGEFPDDYVVEENPDVKKSSEDETELGSRTYIVISPGLVEKRSRKRSIDPVESSSIVRVKSLPTSSADKSARNYFALKITDDMFKGGIEQSNPLGEDKSIERTSFSSSSSSPSSSSSSFSSSGNSVALLRSHKPKSTSPEWKVIEAIQDSREMLGSENLVQPERVLSRRLTQIVSDIPPSAENFSVASESLPTNNLLYTTTLTQRNSSQSDINVTHREVNEDNNFNKVSNVDLNYSNNLTTTHGSNVDKNVQNVSRVSSGGDKNFSINFQPTTTSQLESILGANNSSVINKGHNSTRLRRHAGSYGHEKPLKRRKNRVHDSQEDHQGRKKMSVDGFENDLHHKKLTVLLGTDNIDDDSQIDLAAHGELASKIVERIFEEVQRNEGLKVALGPGLYRKHKPQESMSKMYRQGLDEDEVKETEAMMRRVMDLLGRLVIDEVRRKTCASLAPEMRNFLQWSLGFEEISEPLSDQVPPLPLIPGERPHEATERPSDKFLFQSSPNSESGVLSELERKVSLLKSLINEYRALTEREKTKVQTVHDYLVRQLALLMKYIESKESPSQSQFSDKTAGARLPPGRQHILQYQASVPNRNSSKRQQNESYMTDIDSKNQNNFTSNPRSSIFSQFNVKFNEGRKKGSKAKRESYGGRESLEYRKLLNRIATLRRKKREDSLGYEVPRIYSDPLELSSLVLTTLADLDQPAINSSKPVGGKNRLEDEVSLLNKREAWRKENERMLEEVAFGRDTRNDLLSEKRPTDLDEVEPRIKRAFEPKTAIYPVTMKNILKINGTTNCDAEIDKLRLIEERINVFPVASENSSKSTSGINLTSTETPKF